eukprot:GFUD01043784.1.p1 GENE.GFUD01043784.1~~GFUD01043784.1.p1  ORF type:complete len:738 (+),score=209.89 GFUD01043784.1:61-2214(+)
MAKQLIEDKVKEEEMMRSSVGGRQPRIKHKQPLFLNYEQEDQGEETSLQGEQEELKPTGLDNCMEVFVSAISTPAPPKMSRYVIDRLSSRNIFDSHCHIDFILDRKLRKPSLRTYSSLVDKFPAMHHAKLEGFITNYCDPSTWPVLGTAPPRMLSSAWVSEGLSVNYTVGCHPHFASQLLREGAMETLERLLVEGRGRGCVAVGECGLDCSRKNGVDLEDQVEAFKLQVNLAMKLNLPIVLHIRDAEKEGIQVLQECGLPGDWPVHRHCWNDSWESCQAWLDLFPGSVVGITGLVTYRNADQAREVVRVLPLDRLVLETDAPYFRPEYPGVLPYDNLRFAHPLQVVSVAAQIAEVKSVALEEVLSKCRENVARIYRIPVPGDRMEAVVAVDNILEDVIASVTGNIVKTKFECRELKRFSDVHGGGESKKVKTIVDHLVTKGFNSCAEPFTPGRSGHKISTEDSDGDRSVGGDSVNEVRHLLEEAVLQVEEFSLRMIGYSVPCEVRVSALQTPGAFWVQKIGPKSVDLDKLTQDMTEYYKEEVNQKLHSVTSVAPGDIIACRFSSEESFYRAKVVAFKEDSYDVTRSTVDLDFVDYGDFEEKFISEVYEIRTDFLKLKFQAIQCSMAHLKASPGPEWSAEACDQFEVLTHCAMWKVVWAKVTEYQSGGVPCVELIDTTQTGGDKNIGHELIKLGFASWLDKEDGSDQSDTATTLSRDN